LKIEVKLLLNADSKSYMPRRLAQQRVTLRDLQWHFAFLVGSIGGHALVSSARNIELSMQS